MVEAEKNFVIPDAVQRRSGLRLQDCKRERRRRPEGRAPWTARVIQRLVVCEREDTGFRVASPMKPASPPE
jgi:hypothetical protein